MTRPNTPLDRALVALAAAALLGFVAELALHARLGAQLRGAEATRDDLSRQLAERRSAAVEAEQARRKAGAADDLAGFSDKVAAAMGRLQNPHSGDLGRARLAANYGSLFARLKLSGNRLERMLTLLGERMRVPQELQQLAYAEGVALEDLPDRKEILFLGTGEIDSAIAAELGPEDFATFQAYQQSLNARRYLILPFADHLAGGATALNDGQIDALVAAAGQADFGVNEVVMWPPGPPIPDALDAAASAQLSAAQLQAYADYKAVWDAKRVKAQLDLKYYAAQQAARWIGHGDK